MALTLIWAGVTAAASTLPLPPSSTNRVWHYTLIEGSHLIDDCLICARPAIMAPIRGSFELRLIEESPLFSRYAVEDIAFKAGSSSGLGYEIIGSGTYQIGGEVAIRQDMFLEVYIDDGQTNKLCFFTNQTFVADRRWPIIHITLGQTNGTLVQTYTIELAAAPLQEIWFSSARDFHAGIWQSPSNFISAGDLVSSSGHVVKRNQQLTARLPVPPAEDLGLDALDILPGGEVVISTAKDASSLRHGDLLFSRSGTVLANEDLLRPITRVAPGRDLGLDAVQVALEMQFYFSVQSNFTIFNDPEPVVTIRRGDLLFSDLGLEEGRVVKRNSELLAHFHPANPGTDVGLDAFYLWPSGEIWFSTEEPFQDQELGIVAAGDLLSDHGYIVYRNLQLVSAFKPVEDLNDFGLDALFVISDAAALTPGPRFTSISHSPGTQVARLEWDGAGRVWQVMRATNVAGPWFPISGITPDQVFTDTSATAAQAFYTLRQW